MTACTTNNKDHHSSDEGGLKPPKICVSKNQFTALQKTNCKKKKTVTAEYPSTIV